MTSCSSAGFGGLPGAMSELNHLFSMVPPSVLTDSYKAAHFLQYPKTNEMVAYGEFRSGFEKDQNDTRLVFYGMRYIMENIVCKQWTLEDVKRAEIFYSTHMAPNYSEYPWPKELFLKFIKENNGYFPVRLEALPEGSCVHAHVPVYQLTSSGEYAPLCTYLETILTQVWYPTTVATLSRRTRDLLEKAFDTAADGGKDSPLLESRLHDFGFRGCTCVEQSVIGGVSHLLNFTGTDTMAAAFYAQFALNNGKPVGNSVPATEHSVMTAWATEADAIENMINHFGTGLFACVMDSYDYAKALSEVLPAISQKKVAKGGYMVVRPDSGDPTEAILMALQAEEKVFGVNINSKGYKKPVGAGVIQGDGINYASIKKMLEAVLKAGYSPDAVAFGMGGGLLQRVNRDTMNFATKLCKVVYADGRVADVMKMPTTDSGKISMPGALAVKRVDGVPTVFPKEGGHVKPEENLLKVIYDCGPMASHNWEDFEAVRNRVKSEWAALPVTADVVSEPLKQKMRVLMS